MDKPERLFKFFILITVVLAILAAGVFIIWRQYSPPSEVLIVWGLLDDDKCTIQIIDPDSQKVLNTIDGDPDCFYDVIQSDESDWLVQAQLVPARVTFFDVDSRGHISARYEISAPDMKITSKPQLVSGNLLFVTGVVDGREQVYRFDLVSGQREQLTNRDAMAFEPVVSPDGKYVAYLLDERGFFRDPCCEVTSSQHYQVRNLETGEEIALAPFADLPDHEHCYLSWSPTGNIVAFSSGCNVNTVPQQLVVVDVENNKLLAKFDPLSSELPLVSSAQWVDDTSVAYCSVADFPLDEQPDYYYHGCFVYDTSSQESNEVKFLSLLNMPFGPYSIGKADWMEIDGSKWLVARVTDADATHSMIKSALVTMKMDDDFTQLRLLELGEASIYSWRATLEPVWSPSGNWIAYYDGLEIGIADGSGIEAYGIISAEDFSEVQYAWLRLNTRFSARH